MAFKGTLRHMAVRPGDVVKVFAGGGGKRIDNGAVWTIVSVTGEDIRGVRDTYPAGHEGSSLAESIIYRMVRRAGKLTRKSVDGLIDKINQDTHDGDDVIDMLNALWAERDAIAKALPEPAPTITPAADAARKLALIVDHEFAGENTVMYDCDAARISFNDIRALLAERGDLIGAHDALLTDPAPTPDLISSMVQPLDWNPLSDATWKAENWTGVYRIYPNALGGWTLDDGAAVSSHETPQAARTAGHTEQTRRVLITLGQPE